MAEDDPVGPSLLFSAADGSDVPLYLLSFDKQGACTSPRTCAAVLAAASQFTDLHIYSHGWNNVFDEAVRHYTEFFTEYFALASHAGVDPAGYKPLIVGIIWPSTALLAAGEETPRLAALGAGGAAVSDELTEVCTEMAPEQARQLRELVARPGPLAGDDALALARLLAPVLRAHEGGSDEGPARAIDADADAGAILRNWGTASLAPEVAPGAPGRLGMARHASRAGLEAGGLLEFFNPREIVRKATVYIMKDRAGTVGRAGVAELVRDAVATGCRVHLTGHSYGAKVMLSALSQLPPPRQVTSVLLLQPAISAYCFAERIAEHGGLSGGYRKTLDKTVLPLSTTYSPHDRALSSFYPLALRRGHDQGELEPGAPPSRHAALGAVGPYGMVEGEVEHLPIPSPAMLYVPPRVGVRVRALDGTVGIHGHGDVRNEFTEWALINLVLQGAAP